jgi:signal transduction histidine kinase
LPASQTTARVTRKLLALQPSRAVAIALSFVLTLAAACGDALTAAETTFTLFYVFALMIGTWFGGIATGYTLAAVAVAGGAMASLVNSPHTSSAWFLVWNASLDLALYLGSVRVLWALRNRLEREVSARQDALGQLRHAERLTTIGRLASGIAHEIGSPLNVISGRAELIASGTLSPETVKSSAQIVIEQTERVAVIIRSLLDFARRGGAQVSRTDLTDLVETTALLLGPGAAKAGIEIVCTGTHVEANLNRSEMQQVITNLLINAIDAMPRGGKIEIDTRVEKTRRPGHRSAKALEYAVVRVRDHGTGIASDVLPKIFDPFFTTKDLGHGTGLGLSVAYGIVHDHNGWLSIDTRLGEGTTVSVYTPQ